MKVHKRNVICGICPGGCGVEVELQNGVLIDIKASKDIPFSAICTRGNSAVDIVYSSDRLKKPLMRTGKKGEGKFRETEWDEALDYIADKMKELKSKYGAESLISHSGRGVFEQSFSDFNKEKINLGTELLKEFGSPNIASVGSLCYNSYGILAPMTTYGIKAIDMFADFENSNLIVIWGANPVTDSPPFIFQEIMKARKEGKEIIVIDHMKSHMAKMSDKWIPIRSGTDGALALGIINVVIKEGLYDKEFVENFTIGFKELKEYVKQFTPKEVEHITNVPKEMVIELAEKISKAKYATINTYTGLEYTNSGVQNIRAVYILWALTGNIDVSGGLNFKLPSTSKTEKETKFSTNLKPIGSEEYPVFYDLIGDAQFMEFPKAVLEGKPYKIRGLINIGSSISTSYPEPELFEKSYKELDLMVVIDRFMTNDALYADVILPATTHFEIESYQRYPGHVRLREKVIKPVGEARNDLIIISQLANRLGLGHLYPQTEKEIIEYAFNEDPELLERLYRNESGVKITMDNFEYKKYNRGLLRSDGKPGFPTESGKIEIYSSYLENNGYDPLPKYIEPTEGPLESKDVFEKYPLILNTGARIQSTFRSQHQNISSLLKIQDKPLVLIHPEDSAERGIKQDDCVNVITSRGEVSFYADISEKVLKGTVEVNQGGGNPFQVKEWKEGNVNYLTDFNNRDRISGFPVFKALLCDIEKI